jgi:hypothetical protein
MSRNRGRQSRARRTGRGSQHRGEQQNNHHGCDSRAHGQTQLSRHGHGSR